ncbi:hypothetical protein LINGRAHAP2_LOCUS30365, partial [Linum grandiflorum]
MTQRSWAELRTKHQKALKILATCHVLLHAVWPSWAHPG